MGSGPRATTRRIGGRGLGLSPLVCHRRKRPVIQVSSVPHQTSFLDETQRLSRKNHNPLYVLCTFSLLFFFSLSI